MTRDTTLPATGYRQDIAGCLSTAVGAHGLTPEELKQQLEACAPGLKQLAQDRSSGAIALLKVVAEEADIAVAEAAMARLTKGARTLVLFGTGGSSLGGQMLAQIGGWHVEGYPVRKGRPELRFYDNIDPETLGGALASLDLAATRFIMISKSGGTAETLTQAIATLSALKAAGLAAKLPELVLGITEPDKPGVNNGLRKLLAAHGIPMLEHHTGVGGRYSGLTNVGLVAAIAMGLDARKVRAGAAAVLEEALAAKSAADCPAAVGAAVATALAARKGTRVLVMLPYADRLERVAHWYVQLWAESLGKQGKGTTPLAALGPVDQHSQLQLFMEGPHEHMITVLRRSTYPRGPIIDPEMANLAGVPMMAGKGPGDLVAAQTHAVPEALIKAGRPVRLFDLADVDERVAGALMMHFVLETILAARIMGVDPFDQPGVELGKVLTKKRLETGAA